MHIQADLLHAGVLPGVLRAEGQPGHSQEQELQLWAGGVREVRCQGPIGPGEQGLIYNKLFIFSVILSALM